MNTQITQEKANTPSSAISKPSPGQSPKNKPPFFIHIMASLFGSASSINDRPKVASFNCIICLERSNYIIPVCAQSCNDNMCYTCARSYFDSIAKNDNTKKSANIERIACPGARCQSSFITKDVISQIYTIPAERDAWWAAAVQKSFIKNKVICPKMDCHALFDVDENLLKKCTFTECYECHRGFCIACQGKWHPGVMKVTNDQKDIMTVLKTAKANDWSRCPSCSHLIERKDGCAYILCRCGHGFCYRCGGKMVDHYNCPNKCHLMTEAKLGQVRSSMFTYQEPSTSNIAGVRRGTESAKF